MSYERKVIDIEKIKEQEGICARISARFAAEVKAGIKTESNLRGGAEYRRHLAGVLTKRAVCRLEG